MAAVFLVTLYEYSPLFYITVVFVCFLVTSGLVLGWFGLGVPVILRNSEETESSTRVLKKRMRQVKNPFGLEIPHPATASVTSQWSSDVLDFCQCGFLNLIFSVFLLSPFSFIKIPRKPACSHHHNRNNFYTAYKRGVFKSELFGYLSTVSFLSIKHFLV